ncbi:MAG TPA: VOC family protein [Nocardioides sp.]|uniref:VOC family protein n=1 Tax=Nocardioides sp. TaxID=35761 RepID=UPI002E35DDF6|nr:VOC family protein [Nocardioides sp.]HEX5086509.1 VOC family protein [Nocardioides sp.]
MKEIDRIDHLVLTVADLDRTVAFYTSVLGMGVTTFGEGRMALTFGGTKLNLHQAGHEFEPKALRPTPGSVDLCLVVDDSIEAIAAGLTERGAEIVEGPVARTGARGPILSCYVRDPDGNLVEVCTYRPGVT